MRFPFVIELDVLSGEDKKKKKRKTEKRRRRWRKNKREKKKRKNKKLEGWKKKTFVHGKNDNFCVIQLHCVFHL